MKIKREIPVIFLVVIFIPLTCAGGFAEMDVGDYTLGGYVALGGGFLSDASRNMNKGYLKEYLPFPQGFLADTDLSLKSKDGLEYYRFRMSHPGLRDQDYLLQVGKLGVYHAEIEYDQFQHLYSTVNPFNNEIGILLQRLRFSGYYTPTPDIDIFAENQFLRRTGQQPATFEGSPSTTGGGYSFTTYLRPIDYKQNDMKVGAEIDRPMYQLRMAYHLSTFENAQADLRGGPTGAIVGLPPSNMASYLTAEGALKLAAYKTRITSSFTYGWLTQDDLVYNSTGIFSGNAGLRASTVAADITGVTHPWDPLTLRYSYRAYDFSNDYNRANNILRMAFLNPNQPLLNLEQYSYLRQTITTGADYKVNNKMAFDVAYAWQAVDRTDSQGHTSNNSPQVGIRLFPTSWLNLTANYAYIDRVGSNFLVLAPGNVLTYKVFSGNDKRNNVNFIAEVFPVNDVTFSFNFSLYNDNFNNSVYGLQNDEGWSAGADASWKPFDRVALTLGYDHQQASTKELAPNTPITTTAFLVTGDSGPILRTSDYYDTVTGKADFKLIPDKLKLTTSASYSFSSSNFNNDIMPMLHESFLDVNTFLTYLFNEHWGCRVGYIFEAFKTTQNYQTLYLQGITTANPKPNQSFNTLDGFYRNATAHLVQGFVQYKF